VRGAGGSALVGLVTVVLAGCGSHKVPSVVGMRLDQAEKTVHDAGLGYKEVGGGVFGIIDTANWTVCRTDPPALAHAPPRRRRVPSAASWSVHY
jgi:hypothetical protein